MSASRLVLVIFGALSALSLNASVGAAEETSVVQVSNPYVLERTAETASKLNLALPVAFTEKVCTRTAQRETYGQNPSCGYSTTYVWRCYGGGYYPAPYPYPYPMPYPPAPRSPYYPYPDRNCGYYPVSVMNSCNYLENYCAEYGSRVVTRMAPVVIKFKRSAKLSAGQTERFELSAAQAGSASTDADFLLKPINTQKEYYITSRERFFSGAQVMTVKAKQ